MRYPLLSNAFFISEVFGGNGKCFRRNGLSLSSGYAIAEEHPKLSIEELVDIADKMMYAKKEKYYQNRKISDTLSFRGKRNGTKVPLVEIE